MVSSFSGSRRLERAREWKVVEIKLPHRGMTKQRAADLMEYLKEMVIAFCVFEARLCREISETAIDSFPFIPAPAVPCDSRNSFTSTAARALTLLHLVFSVSWA